MPPWDRPRRVCCAKGGSFSVSSFMSYIMVTISLTMRRYLSCLCHASTSMHARLSVLSRLLSWPHGVSWADTLMLLKVRWMRLFSHGIPVRHLSLCPLVIRSGDIWERFSPLPGSCFFPSVRGEVPIFKCPPGTRCQLYHPIRTRLWRECLSALP